MDAERLDGAWEGSFRLARPIQLTLDPAAIGAVTARITLEQSDGADVAGLPGPSTHFGAYSANFTSFGFDPAPRGAVPPAAARLSGDSVSFVLGDPRNPIELSGRLTGDSVTGVWRYETDRATGVATGEFTLRRPPPTGP